MELFDFWIFSFLPVLFSSYKTKVARPLSVMQRVADKVFVALPLEVVLNHVGSHLDIKTTLALAATCTKAYTELCVNDSQQRNQFWFNKIVKEVENLLGIYQNAPATNTAPS